MALFLATLLQQHCVFAVNTVIGGSVEDTWGGGGFELRFQVNLTDGVKGGWAVVMGLNYMVDTMRVSLHSFYTLTKACLQNRYPV